MSKEEYRPLRQSDIEPLNEISKHHLETLRIKRDFYIATGQRIPLLLLRDITNEKKIVHETDFLLKELDED